MPNGSCRVYVGTPIETEEIQVLASCFRVKRIPFFLIGANDRCISFVNSTTENCGIKMPSGISACANWRRERRNRRDHLALLRNLW